MKIMFKLGNEEEIKEVFSVFEHAVDHMISIGINQWDSIYPSIEVINKDIQNHHLYVGKVGKEIATVFVLNKKYDQEYDNGEWKDQSGQFAVIHRLCVHPKFQNMGIARLAMLQIDRKARADAIRSLRLDTFSQNPFALQLYASLGYERVGEANWRKGKFYLMEKILCSDEC